MGHFLATLGPASGQTNRRLSLSRDANHSSGAEQNHAAVEPYCSDSSVHTNGELRPNGSSGVDEMEDCLVALVIAYGSPSGKRLLELSVVNNATFQCFQSSTVLWTLMQQPTLPGVMRCKPYIRLCTEGGTLFKRFNFLADSEVDDIILSEVGESSLAPIITSINLQATAVTDGAIQDLLKKLPSLTELGIDRCNNVSAGTLSLLSKSYPSVKTLSFSATYLKAPSHYTASNCTPDGTKMAMGRRKLQSQWGNFRGSAIISNLVYLGDAADSRSIPEMRALGIRRILSVAAECPPSDEVEASDDFTVLFIPLNDHSDEDIASRLPAGVQFMREAVERRQPVLVHCRHGVSRSATFVMAYIMHYGLDPDAPTVTSYDDAFDHVKSCRMQVSPNLGFVLALHELDAELRGEDAARDLDYFETPFGEGGHMTEVWEDFDV